ncbi:MAG: hypothetical protein NW214_09545 [Pseudanabaenaceae cyanobacterium bins.39]|nr:hypothetical protein [Pseudanabaenaceae cyanobacterium bins.39]
MTSTLIPKASSMPSEPDPDDFRYRLWCSVQQYADSNDPSDRLFARHVHEIATTIYDSRSYHRAETDFYQYVSKLGYGADKNFRERAYANWARDFVRESMPLVLATAIREMWKPPKRGFNPTGESLVGCWRKYVNEKVRLKYILLDEYRKIRLDVPNEGLGANGDNKINLSDLNQFIASDQAKIREQEKEARLKQQEAKLLTAFEKDVLESDFWVINYIKNEPKLTYRLLTMRLKHNFCLGREKFQAIVDEFCPIAEDATPEEIAKARDSYYSRVDRQLRDHFYPDILTRRLTKNLFTPLQIEQIREAIANSESLDIPVYKNYPAITPKFMAEKLLPMFQPKPLTIAEIIKLLQSPEYDYLTYKKLDEPKLQQIWDKKCAPKIGKIAAQVLTYSS